MIRFLSFSLFFSCFSAFADTVFETVDNFTGLNITRSTQIEARSLSGVVKMKKAKLETKGGEGLATVQPTELLSFEYASSWAETFEVFVLANDWESDFDGRRDCYVFAKVIPVVRPQVAKPELNRKYNIQVASDANECRNWKLFNIQ